MKSPAVLVTIFAFLLGAGSSWAQSAQNTPAVTAFSPFVIGSTYGTSNDVAVVVDPTDAQNLPNGDILITGNTGTGGIPWTAGTDSASFLMRVTGTGEIVWQRWLRPMRNWGMLRAQAFAFSATGEIYVAGVCHLHPTLHPVSVNPQFEAGMHKLVLLKFSAAGSLLWQEGFQVTAPDELVRSLVVNDSGDVCILFGPEENYSRELWKVAGDGHVLWQRTLFSSMGSIYLNWRSMAVDRDGSATLVGECDDSFNGNKVALLNVDAAGTAISCSYTAINVAQKGPFAVTGALPTQQGFMIYGLVAEKRAETQRVALAVAEISREGKPIRQGAVAVPSRHAIEDIRLFAHGAGWIASFSTSTQRTVLADFDENLVATGVTQVDSPFIIRPLCAILSSTGDLWAASAVWVDTEMPFVFSFAAFDPFDGMRSEPMDHSLLDIGVEPRDGPDMELIQSESTLPGTAPLMASDSPVTVYPVRAGDGEFAGFRWLATHDFFPRYGEVLSWATINDTRVRLRDAPGLASRTIKLLDKGIGVHVMDRSAFPSQVDSMNAPWYHVRLVDGTEGWVYGAYVTLHDEGEGSGD